MSINQWINKCLWTKCLALLGGVVLALPLSAGTLRVKGDSGVFDVGSRISEHEHQQAISLAKRNGILSYLREFRAAAAQQFERCSLSEAHIDSLYDSFKEHRPDQAKQQRPYRVRILGVVQESQLNTVLDGCQPGNAGGQRVAIVLVARQKNTAGSLEKYQTFQAHLDASMAGLFRDRAFDVDSKIDLERYSDHIFKQRELIEQYVYEGEVNWERARIAADISGIDLLVFGFIDVDLETKDAVTGLSQVIVRGNAHILDLATNALVASTERFKFQGMGESKDDAADRASQSIVSLVATQLIDQVQLAKR